MDRPRDDHTERSESGRERQAPYEITCVWNLNYDTDEFICETETGSRTQRTDLWSQSGKWGWGRMGYGVAIGRCKLLHVGWTSNKVLL